ncbi:hypothetical protein [Klenkia marina]|uniref:hypothetical protein n=1 Tax=Klenkia marina TaxID=1960309 RepID=UPI00105A5294|nr:hypothetical protein [Klenkia marina]
MDKVDRATGRGLDEGRPSRGVVAGAHGARDEHGAELEKCDGRRRSGRPAATLGLLHNWVAEGYEQTMAELVAATNVSRTLARSRIPVIERNCEAIRAICRDGGEVRPAEVMHPGEA